MVKLLFASGHRNLGSPRLIIHCLREHMMVLWSFRRRWTSHQRWPERIHHSPVWKLYTGSDKLVPFMMNSSWEVTSNDSRVCSNHWSELRCLQTDTHTVSCPFNIVCLQHRHISRQRVHFKNPLTRLTPTVSPVIHAHHRTLEYSNYQKKPNASRKLTSYCRFLYLRCVQPFFTHAEKYTRGLMIHPEQVVSSISEQQPPHCKEKKEMNGMVTQCIKYIYICEKLLSTGTDLSGLNDIICIILVTCSDSVRGI